MILKKKKQYQNDPAVIKIIKYCVKCRLEEKQTIEKLFEYGYEPSIRTIRRIKRDLPKPKRLDNLVEEEFRELIDESKEDIRQAILETKKVIIKPQNQFVKLRAIDLLSKLRKELIEICDLEPVIASLKERLKSAKT